MAPPPVVFSGAARLAELPDTIRVAIGIFLRPTQVSNTAAESCSSGWRIPDVHAILLLSVFHHILVTLAIPTADELDCADENSPVGKTLFMALFATRGFVNVGVGRSVSIPDAACRELWPRMAEWLRYILTFHENAPWLGLPSQEWLCIDVAGFAGAFKHDKPTAELFAATPAFNFMIGRAWHYLLKKDTFGGLAYANIYHFLTTYLDIRNPANLREIVEGAGDGFDNLGFLIVGQINRLLSGKNTALTKENISYLRSLLSMVIHFSIKTETQPGKVAVMGPLTAAFVPHGGAQTFAALALAVSRARFSDDVGMHFVFEKCLMVLSAMFGSAFGYKRLAEALEGGFLAALICAAKSSWANKVHEHSENLINFVIRPYTVYYSVLSKMNGALLDTAAEERDQRFTSSTLSFWWMTLRESTRERLEALKYFRTQNTDHKACDNDDCGKIGEKAEFKRCAGCHSSYYCSAACQAHDWRNGAHVQHCTPNPVFSLNERVSLWTRDRSFLRALIHYDYCQKAEKIFLDEIKFIHRHPDTPSFVLFDYTLMNPEITVVAIADDEVLSRSPHWQHWVSRAEKSRGRIRLHVMRVREGTSPTHWVIPLRTDTSRVYDGLRQIAAALPAEQARWKSEAIVHQIEALVANDGDSAVEIR
ncbi:hypothetical protein B0H19DRAFT_1072019 [Mycena capillaripes]|nr:hypothetical protein B0H19DRAFT_1072019 [Mycena capillaripes]